MKQPRNARYQNPKVYSSIKITIMRRRRTSRRGRRGTPRRTSLHRKQKRKNKRYNSYRIARGGIRL